ncbi:hypothetical protein TNCV_1477551 [Trichonephila clavipes]|nr:hypothetical protein TNCV_1477551 [Trichonephila clavipes]
MKWGRRMDMVDARSPRGSLDSQARRIRMVREDTGAPNEGATCVSMAADEVVGCFLRFSNLVQSKHPEMLIRRKCLSMDEMTNFLRELSEDESDGGELVI